MTYKFKAGTEKCELIFEWIGFAGPDNHRNPVRTMNELGQNACILNFIMKHKEYFESILNLIKEETYGEAFSYERQETFKPVFIEDLAVFVGVS